MRSRGNSTASGLPKQASEFARKFKALSGVDVVVHRPMSVSGLPSSVSVVSSSAAQEIFGDFGLTVFPNPQIAANFSMPSNQGPANDDGIVWKQHYEPISWTAIKLHGNVQLFWQATQPQIDDRWRKLDKLVRDALSA